MSTRVKYNINTKLIDDFKIEEIDERQEEGLIYFLDHEYQGLTWVTEKVVTSLLAKPLPKIPPFVAFWLETAKDCGKTLAESITPGSIPKKVGNWIWETDTDHMELYTRAWIEGYIEDIRCYLVTDGGICYLSKWDDEHEDKMIIITSNARDFDKRVRKYFSEEAADSVAKKLGWQVKEK
ncbi:DUF1642 domain-containing protein [Streptococcus hyointestinalis]